MFQYGLLKCDKIENRRWWWKWLDRKMLKSKLCRVVRASVERYTFASAAKTNRVHYQNVLENRAKNQMGTHHHPSKHRINGIFCFWKIWPRNIVYANIYTMPFQRDRRTERKNDRKRKQERNGSGRTESEREKNRSQPFGIRNSVMKICHSTNRAYMNIRSNRRS